MDSRLRRDGLVNAEGRTLNNWRTGTSCSSVIGGDELQAGRSSQAVIGRVRGPFLKADLFEWYKDEDRRWWITWENGLKEFFGGQEVRDPYRSTACMSDMRLLRSVSSYRRVRVAIHWSLARPSSFP